MPNIYPHNINPHNIYSAQKYIFMQSSIEATTECAPFYTAYQYFTLWINVYTHRKDFRIYINSGHLPGNKLTTSHFGRARENTRFQGASFEFLLVPYKCIRSALHHLSLGRVIFVRIKQCKSLQAHNIPSLLAFIFSRAVYRDNGCHRNDIYEEHATHH